MSDPYWCPFPVGMEIELADGTDPNEYYPGTEWLHIRDGRVTLAANGDYPLGDTGGVPEVALTVEQMPAHSHSMFVRMHLNSGTYTENRATWTSKASAPVNTGSTGGGKAHTNMQPWRAVNRWRRVA